MRCKIKNLSTYTHTHTAENSLVKFSPIVIVVHNEDVKNYLVKKRVHFNFHSEKDAKRFHNHFYEELAVKIGSDKSLGAENIRLCNIVKPLPLFGRSSSSAAGSFNTTKNK